jgi:hypothetical protein
MRLVWKGTSELCAMRFKAVGDVGADVAQAATAGESAAWAFPPQKSLAETEPARDERPEQLVVCQATFAVLMSRFRRGLLVLWLRQWMYRRMRRAWVAATGARSDAAPSTGGQ